jgi:hypothetical protein
LNQTVVPAEAGTHGSADRASDKWIPAFAGMTTRGGAAICGEICRSRDQAMGMEPYDIVGFAGAAIFVAVYFANQQRWLSSEDWRYPFANLIGAVLILVSLLYEWNFPSVVIEVFWAVISLYGMAKSWRERRSA